MIQLFFYKKVPVISLLLMSRLAEAAPVAPSRSSNDANFAQLPRFVRSFYPKLGWPFLTD
jgi:hypothetical protein